jgi:hypothetical protein
MQQVHPHHQQPQEQVEVQWAEDDEQLMQICLRYDPWNEFLDVLVKKQASMTGTSRYGMLLVVCLFMSSAMLRLRAR